MKLRRLAVAVLAVGIPLLGFAAPAGAATYPPGVPTQQKTVAPGVVYGGLDRWGATSSTRAAASDPPASPRALPSSSRSAAGSPERASRSRCTPPAVRPARSTRSRPTATGRSRLGPLRLNAPGSYRFTFRGLRGTVQGLGVGGVGSRGLSRVTAAANGSVAVTLTVPADGTLPHTGSDSGGPSTAIWGGGLLLLGALLLLVVRARRRRTPAPVELSTP